LVLTVLVAERILPAMVCITTLWYPPPSTKWRNRLPIFQPGPIAIFTRANFLTVQ